MNINKLKESITHNWPAKTISLAIALIIFVFNRFSSLETKKITVSLNPPEVNSLIITNSIPQKITIQLRGIRGEISAINENDIIAYIDTDSFSGIGKYEVPVSIRKLGSALQVDTLEIDINPPVIAVELDNRVLKTVIVTPSILGKPPQGFELKNQIVNPAKIEIEGPENFLTRLSTISTEQINLSQRSESFTRNIKIKVPELVKIRGSDSVECTLNIEPIQITKDISNIAVSIINLDPAFKVEQEQNSVNLRLQGYYTAIETIDFQNNILYLDCSTVTKTGVYELKVLESLPDDVTVMSIEPDNIQITVLSTEVN
ncbi:MAG: hypothetical protein Ta2F_00040 [Termitinemataceae bacterium]|nr:MAG: hypothetical protein Ta2F_00040 [Termitinemataceae bacterium]